MNRRVGRSNLVRADGHKHIPVLPRFESVVDSLVALSLDSDTDSAKEVTAGSGDAEEEERQGCGEGNVDTVFNGTEDGDTMKTNIDLRQRDTLDVPTREF